MIGGPGADSGNLHPLPEMGVILEERESKVIVGFPMPGGDAALKEDDVLSSVNGTAIRSLEEFRGVYDALAV